MASSDYNGPMNTMYGGAGYLNYLAELAEERKAKSARGQAEQGALNVAENQSAFGGTAQTNYNNATAQMEARRKYLEDVAAGRISVTGQQLRQGLQQQNAQQIGYAAGAAPGNAAMAARQAANNIGRAGTAMAGNAAVAGLQERAAAEAALGNMILQGRGQDANVALGGGQNAISGYGTILGQPRSPGFMDYVTGVGSALGSAALMRPSGGTAASDERLKKDITPADDKAKRTLDGLKAYAYKYKDTKHGKGEQFGIMAQDLAKSGLGHAVIDTPEGKMVHGAKLATSLAGLAATLHKRVAKLERKGKRK